MSGRLGIEWTGECNIIIHDISLYKLSER